MVSRGEVGFVLVVVGLEHSVANACDTAISGLSVGNNVDCGLVAHSAGTFCSDLISTGEWWIC